MYEIHHSFILIPCFMFPVDVTISMYLHYLHHSCFNDLLDIIFQRHLGKTANGEWVNLELYEGLRNMGYQEKLAAAALRHANNNMNAALNVLMENPELLESADSQKDREDLSQHFSADKIAQVRFFHC